MNPADFAQTFLHSTLQQQAGGFPNTHSMRGYLNSNNMDVQQMQNFFAMNDARLNPMMSGLNKFAEANLGGAFSSNEQALFRRVFGSVTNNSALSGLFGGSMINFGQGVNALASSGMSVGGTNVYGPGRVSSMLTYPLMEQLQNTFINEAGIMKGSAGGLDRTELGDVATYLANNGSFRGLEVGSLQRYSKGDFNNYIKDKGFGLDAKDQNFLKNAIDNIEGDPEYTKIQSKEVAKKYMATMLRKTSKDFSENLAQLTDQELENISSLSRGELTDIKVSEQAAEKIKNTMKETAQTVGIMKDIYKGANKTMAELMEITQIVSGERLVSAGSAQRARSNIMGLVAAGQGYGFGSQQVMQIAQSTQSMLHSAGFAPGAAAGFGNYITPTVMAKMRYEQERFAAYDDSTLYSRQLSPEEIQRNSVNAIVRFTRRGDEGEKFLAGRVALQSFDESILKGKTKQNYMALKEAVASGDQEAVARGVQALTGRSVEGYISGLGGNTAALNLLSAENSKLLMGDFSGVINKGDRAAILKGESPNEMARYMRGSLRRETLVGDVENREETISGLTYLNNVLSGANRLKAARLISEGKTEELRDLLTKNGETQDNATSAVNLLMRNKSGIGNNYGLIDTVMRRSGDQFSLFQTLDMRTDMLNRRMTIDNMYDEAGRPDSFLMQFYRGFMNEDTPLTNRQRLEYLSALDAKGTLNDDRFKTLNLNDFKFGKGQDGAALKSFYEAAGIRTKGVDFSTISKQQVMEDFLNSNNVVNLDGSGKMATADSSLLNDITAPELRYQSFKKAAQALGVETKDISVLGSSTDKDTIDAIIKGDKAKFSTKLNELLGKEKLEDIDSIRVSEFMKSGYGEETVSNVKKQLQDDLSFRKRYLIAEENGEKNLAVTYKGLTREKADEEIKAIEAKLDRLDNLMNPDKEAIKAIELEVSEDGKLKALIKYMLDLSKMTEGDPKNIFEKFKVGK